MPLLKPKIFAFDRLYAEKDKIEEMLGRKLSWERLDNKRASRIALYHPGAITDDQEMLTQLQAWAVEAANRFYKAVAELANHTLRAIE